MLSEDDVGLFFVEGEFATAGELDGAPVLGILDNGYLEALGGIASAEASYLLPSASAAGAGQTSTLVAAGQAWRVRSVEPDGTGATRLRLERQ